MEITKAVLRALAKLRKELKATLPTLPRGHPTKEQQKRARQAKKHQKVILIKEIKFRPKVDEHDYQFKKKHIERFLEEGDKVKATIFFRGREMAHPEIGRRILERLVEELADVAICVSPLMPWKIGGWLEKLQYQLG